MVALQSCLWEWRDRTRVVTLKYPIGNAHDSEVLYGPNGEPTKAEYDATGRVISHLPVRKFRLGIHGWRKALRTALMTVLAACLQILCGSATGLGKKVLLCDPKDGSSGWSMAAVITLTRYMTTRPQERDRALAHKSKGREGAFSTGMDLMFADVEGESDMILAIRAELRPSITSTISRPRHKLLTPIAPSDSNPAHVR